MAKARQGVKALTDAPSDPRTERERRLAEALRQNLRRRKAQARASGPATTDEAKSVINEE